MANKLDGKLKSRNCLEQLLFFTTALDIVDVDKCKESMLYILRVTGLFQALMRLGKKICCSFLMAAIKCLNYSYF